MSKVSSFRISICVSPLFYFSLSRSGRVEGELGLLFVTSANNGSDLALFQSQVSDSDDNLEPRAAEDEAERPKVQKQK